MFDITQRRGAENKLRESEKRLRFLSAELIRAQETERKRIASELHDSIASSLGTALMGLGRARRALPINSQGHELITRVITMVKQTVKETRRLMNLLRPPMLDDLGLLPAITWFLDQYSAIYSGLAINKDIAVEDADIPENMKIDMYRIIQEAFTNIAKHSNASAAELSLKKKDDVIELTIADNGQGFNPDAGLAAKRGASGFGLISMKERAELAGGTMLIQSSAGKGTTVCARWSAGA
jgi:signal transduction histidine kinase